jgi:hypothetical protein
MTTLKTAAVAAVVILALSAAGQAQQPSRPGEPGRSESTRTVTLSLTEYNRLVDLATRPVQGPSIAPVGAVLSSADLRIRVERDTVHGIFNLTGDVLRPGINRIGLVSGATLIEGTAAGRPLPLAAEGNVHSALLPGPGPFALTLEWGAPLTFVPGRGSFTLPVPSAGTARATVDLPGDQADVRFSAGLVTRRSTSNGRTLVEVTLRPGAATEVSWSMRDSAPVAAARDVRMLADVFTLVTLGDSDVRMAALVDVTVAQGDPRTIDVKLPQGYELTGITGNSLESSVDRDGSVVLTLAEPSARRHQFLVSLERSHGGGSFEFETSFISLPGAQRERGEIAIEGVGTLELAAEERGGMHRMDVRELNPALQSLARVAILSAFRYQRAAGTQIALAMDVKRFPDAGVLPAIAERAVATTLVTGEGRALTEIQLRLENRAQPFLKVLLPAGATMVSVDVAGQVAKPVLGTDGIRVPLLRPGFRPNGTYTVSFVYLHAGTPLARKGDLQVTLPKIDVPVGIVEWEVFVPENYTVRASDGNVIERRAFGLSTGLMTVQTGASGVGSGVGAGYASGRGGGVGGGTPTAPAVVAGGSPGQIVGRAADESGSPMPGVTVSLDARNGRSTAVTDSSGTFLFSGVPDGSVTLTAQMAGFAAQSRTFTYDREGRRVEFRMAPPSVSEGVNVSAMSFEARSVDAQRAIAPSQNVIDLQRKAAGVLPVRLDVPRAGVSHQFVKPLLVGQEAMVNLRYKRR